MLSGSIRQHGGHVMVCGAYTHGAIELFQLGTQTESVPTSTGVSNFQLVTTDEATQGRHVALPR